MQGLPILRSDLFRPGQRVAVAVSGGSDSVALLRRMLEEKGRLAIELSVAHVHHGIRGAAADEDEAFVSQLARSYDLPFHSHRADAPATAASLGETLEEAARNLRYGFFRKLISHRLVDAVATAHTLDDQAETVLHKLIRGAFTEGLSGIHPVLSVEQGAVLRPFLENRHAGLQDWLRAISQPWQEDASNQDVAYTRNRIRLQLLPLLRTFNPQVEIQLARLATLSADEETYWDGELRRLLPSLLLPGLPSRGGGRSTSTHPEQAAVAIEQGRLRELPIAAARRVVRAAARQLGARLGFEQTEQVLDLLKNPPEPGRKFDLPGQLRVERSLREIRLRRNPEAASPAAGATYTFAIPGEITSAEFGFSVRGEYTGGETSVTLRAWKAGDRVTLRHSRGPKKVSEVLDRLRISGDERKDWPVLEAGGTIVWMKGADVEAGQMRFTVQFFA